MNSSYTSRSSSSSPIGLKRRPDVVIKEVVYQGETFWVCKDPLDQQFQRLNEQEYAVLSWLDGTVSFDDLRDKFERRFTPYRVSLGELVQVLGQFHEKSLIYASDANQGLKLLEMGREKLRGEIKQKAMSAHAIKWKGFDPEVFLNATNKYVTWFFSAKAVVVVMSMMLLVVAWLTLHYEQVMAKAPGLWSFVGASNWLTLGLVVASTKLIHEFGHAYSFKRFGGEVHEIGVMIFFFMPTMYCNTSDSWMLPNKWERIAVALGGVYVELATFTLASCAWWFSGPGIVQDVSINLMFVCSLSAVVVNGNPLLKYDGYFVLSDLFEIPNLQQDAGDQIRRKFMVHGLGIQDEETPWLSLFNRRFLLIYGIAAYFFKLSLMLTVAYFLVSGAAPFGLAPIGFMFASVVTAVYLGTPLYKLGKKLKTPGTMIKIKKTNLRITLAIVAAIILLLFVPLPYYVNTDCTLDGCALGTVVTQEAGELKQVRFEPGDYVKKGDLIIELSNPGLEKACLQGQQLISVIEIELENRKYDLFQPGNGGASSIDVLKEKLVGLRGEQKQLQQKLAALQVRAPIDGRVVGMQSSSRPAYMNDERTLKTDHGNILFGRESTWLKSGFEVCRICAADEVWATLTIKQCDQDLVDQGQKVKMLFHSDRSRVYESTVDRLSYQTVLPQDLTEYEAESATIKTLAQSKAAASQGEPVNTDGASMDASVQLAQCRLESAASIPLGAHGVAKIYQGPRSLIWRFVRSFRLFINTKL